MSGIAWRVDAVEENGAQQTEDEELPEDEHKAGEKVAAFLDAAQRGCVDDVLNFLKEGVDLSSVDVNGETALHWAAREGHLDVVNALIAAGSPLFDDTVSGSPLHLAAAHGHADVIAVLLAAGAGVDARDDVNETALHYAVRSGHAACVELLLAAGADQQAADPLGGMTPLHTAVSTNLEDCVRAFLRHGADVNAQSSCGYFPIHCAQTPKMVVVLAQAGANLNARDSNGNTPLHWLAGCGPVDLIEQLLKVGANPSIRNSEGRRPVDIAKDHRIKALLRDAMKGQMP